MVSSPYKTWCVLKILVVKVSKNRPVVIGVDVNPAKVGTI